MRANLLRFATAVCLTALWVGQAAAQAGLEGKAGLGYEFMSQEFFLDSLALAGADSVELATALETTYLNDPKSYLGFTWRPTRSYQLELGSIYEQTPDQFRLRFQGEYRPRVGDFSFDLRSELDWRDATIEPGEEDEGYYSGYSRARVSLALSPQWSLFSRFNGDFVRFDRPRETAYDYTRFGGQFGILKYFSNFSSLEVGLFAAGREVLRQTEQDYTAFGLESNLLGFFSGGEVSVLTHYEIRDYDRVGELGDYRWFDLDIRSRFSLKSNFFIRSEVALEALSFDSTDLYIRDYTRLQAAVLLGFTDSDWSLAAGPDIRLLVEDKAADYLIGQDYLEAGLKVQLDLIRPGQLFASVESITGRRDVDDEGADESLQSDFTYQRLNILFDWSITGGLNLNLLASSDWEWHTDSADNNRLSLITTGLYCSF